MTVLRSHLLGFDARVAEAEAVQDWPVVRRLTYLLRDDVRWPLSVDRSVWPSVFRFGSGEDVNTDAIAVVPQTFLQEAIELWDSRAAMEQAIAASRARTAIPIALELCHETELAADDSWSFLAGSLPTDDIPQGWRVIGYDIADRDLLTSLSNCSYNERDREIFMVWAKEINKFGLIDDLELARDFRDLSDDRVPDHAPFFVYRIRGLIP